MNIQLHGRNGYYGLLRKTESGKYINNFILLDKPEYLEVADVGKKSAGIISEKFAAFMIANEQKILAMPFLNKQSDTRLIAWPLIRSISWKFSDMVAERVQETLACMLDDMVEKCLELGLIDTHMQAGPGAEGVVMVVRK